MSDRTTNLWPYTTRSAVIAVPIVLLLLIIAVSVTRLVSGWPSPASEHFVLIGIFVLSLVPLLLALIDALIKQAAVVEFKGLKLSLAQVSAAIPPTALIPTNIGVRATPVNDSSSAQILSSLQDAANNEVVVIDLEDGQAWWETRLLVLLAGASRLNRPEAAVFLGTVGGRSHQFQGWGYCRELFRNFLQSDARYLTTYQRTRAAANAWALIEPGVPATGLTGLALNRLSMAFPAGGSPNEFAGEQLLASELGSLVEMSGQQQTISVVRLQHLFASVLHTSSVDQSASNAEQLRQLESDEGEYVAVTQGGQYLQLVRRLTVLTVLIGRTIGSAKPS